MREYVVLERVPGGHPRWHARQTVMARSRPDALRRVGFDPGPRQNGVIAGGAYRMSWRADRVDFDYRAIDGTIVPLAR